MRLFGTTSEEAFKEYVETEFQAEYRESILEDWLENNPHSIIEDGNLFIIGHQVTTNLGSFVDLLAVDKRGDVAVIELKRDRALCDTLAQALEYASFAAMKNTRAGDGATGGIRSEERLRHLKLDCVVESVSENSKWGARSNNFWPALAQ